ncbi:uncharacterized protein LOC128358907 [Scomber scombrus]|uniref:Uncharacterized protein LOC128358907 n=1 Tax=Scomber scombrus TaxID=13677 RepID=A0AAV1P7S0_SCOSC
MRTRTPQEDWCNMFSKCHSTVCIHMRSGTAESYSKKMVLKRRLYPWMYFFLPLIWGNISTAEHLSGVVNETMNLVCTNDLDSWINCQCKPPFEEQNCTVYTLTIDEGYEKKSCIFQQCDSVCCCRVNMGLIIASIYTADVLKGGTTMMSKNISTSESIKPKAPTISVKEVNGNFEVTWETNMKQSVRESLHAEVTYRKKGDTKEVEEPHIINASNSYDIRGQDLEPSTTYVVSVRNYFNWSGLYSDSSQELEFTTSAPPHMLLLSVFVSLTFVAVIITSVVMGCFQKLKAKWWDTVAKCPNPELLEMRPGEQMMLKPKPPIISSICVEPFIPVDSKPWSKGSLTDICSNSLHQSSGISTGSSALSYAHTEPADIIACVQDALGKAFPNISPISPVTSNLLTESTKGSGSFSTPYNNCSVKAYDSSSGSSGFDNKTYSILIPACQTVTDSSENQTQAEMLCDSAYHPSEGDMMTCLDKQAPACLVPVQDIIFPPVASSLIQTDMSYQGNADSGRFSYAEDSSLSSISSSTNTTASCDLLSRVENFDECVVATKPDGQSEEVTVCDENPCYNCVPPNSCNFLPVDDNYQAFQSLVKPPDVLISEQRSGEEEEDFDRYPEKASTNILQSFLSPVFPDFTNGVQGGRCFSELQNPFLTVISAGQSLPIITDSGYQSV